MRLFRFITLMCLCFMTVLSTTSAHYSVSLYHWSTDETCFDLDALNSVTYEPLAEEAVDDWNAAIDTSDFQIVDEGATDCANDLFFTNLSSYETANGVLVTAITPCSYNLTTLVINYCDTQFDSQDSWTANKSNNVDFHHVALHEFGHWFILNHVDSTDHIMYGSYTGLNTIHAHDAAGVDFLYDIY